MGKLEVVARNSQGQATASCELKVVPRSDDYRNVLKHSPKRELPLYFLFLDYYTLVVLILPALHRVSSAGHFVLQMSAAFTCLSTNAT